MNGYENNRNSPVYRYTKTAPTSGSIAAEIADHLPVFSLVYDPKCSPIPDTIKVRDLKKFDNISFQNTLRNVNWLPYIIVVIQMKVCRDSFTFLIELTMDIHL